MPHDEKNHLKNELLNDIPLIQNKNCSLKNLIIFFMLRSVRMEYKR